MLWIGFGPGGQLTSVVQDVFLQQLVECAVAMKMYQVLGKPFVTLLLGDLPDGQCGFKGVAKNKQVARVCLICRIERRMCLEDGAWT